jgi:uncharacterized protein (UPF0332 family)
MIDKESLFLYRMEEAEETLKEAKKMLNEGFSPRATINRTYYSMFYMVLALFIKNDINIKASKHKGIISLFDKEFVKTGKINKQCSEALHNTFNARQEGDYREFTAISPTDAAEYIKLAEEFFEEIKKLII